MFALMSTDTDDMHLRFTYDEEAPEKIIAERTTVVDAPLENQIFDINRYVDEALRIVFLMEEEKRERGRAIRAIRASRQGARERSSVLEKSGNFVSNSSVLGGGRMSAIGSQR